MAIKIEKNSECRPDSESRNIRIEDSTSLARLMHNSYRGTIDYEGETLQQCEDEMLATIKNKYGLFDQNSSSVVFRDGKAVSVCMITIWNAQPLIAFSMTDPDYQGQGFAKQLIFRALNELARGAYKTLYLVVTDGNTAAQNLYRRMGFKEIGEALPNKPVPQFDW